MGIMFGLLAAIGWGAADFLVSETSRRVGTRTALFFIQLAGFCAILLVLLGRFELPQAPMWTWGLAVALGALNAAATALIYRCYTIGKLAIVSPITSGFAVVTAILALASGERPAPLALTGALLLVVGVAAVARSTDTQDGAEHATPAAQVASFRLPAGVPEAIGVAFGFGIYFWGLDVVAPALGTIWPIVISRAVSVIGVLLWLGISRQNAGRLPGRLWPMVLGTAILDTLAFLAFTAGIATVETSIVTALASMFSACTVLMAWAISRERLAAHQWVGVGVILAGVLLVSV